VHYVSVAAPLHGLDESQVYDWLRKGKGEIGRLQRGKPIRYPFGADYIRFANAFAKAIAERTERLLLKVEQGGPGWQAAAWILERTMPDLFALRDRKELADLAERVKEMEANARLVRRVSKKPKTSAATPKSNGHAQ
jgi:hypothetical protein